MPDPGPAQILKRYWPILIIPLVAALCLLIAIRLDNSMQAGKNDRDFLPFWLAGNMVGKGQNPYDASQWQAGYTQYETSLELNPAFLYPLPLALLFAPLGLLPFRSAFIVWVTLSQLMIIAALVSLLTLDKNPRAKLFFIPILTGVVFFRPTILTLTQGQVSGLFLIILVGLAFLWQKGYWFQGSLLLGLLALKPNLGIPIIGLLAIWLLIQKQWKALHGTLVSGIILLVAGLIYDPTWVSQYWLVGNSKLAVTFGGSPTVWGLGALISHNNSIWTLLFGGLTALGILFGFFRTILRRQAVLKPLSVLALAVCVTLLITPYTWTYDQLLLLLPVTVVILGMDRMGVRFPLTATLFLGLDLLAVILLFFNAALQVEILNVVVPAAVFGMCRWRNVCQ